MTRVDLDAFERMLIPGGLPTFSDSELRAIVAELRAAREVIEEADSYRSWLPLTVVEKLDAYDQAVGS